MNRHTLVYMAAALAVALTLHGCAQSDSAAKTGEKAEAEAVLLAPADVAEVRVADLSAGVPVSGSLRPSVDIKLTAPLPDLIEQVLVQEGQAVRKGQVLARFRNRALAPEAASAEAQRRHAASDYARMQNLAKAGAVSQQDVENAEAELKAADAKLADARRRLDEATVRSPIHGVVAERSVQSGDRVGDGDPLFRVVDTRELEFEATVPGEHVGAIKVGAPVRLTVSGSEAAVVGRIARINATADEATRQVRVYVAVPNPKGTLVGGLFASGELVTAQATDVPAVPSAAVRSGDTPSVMAIVNGRLVRKPVTTGVRDEGRDLVQVIAGVAAGDTVVTGPVEGLEPGRAVIVGGKER